MRRGTGLRGPRLPVLTVAVATLGLGLNLRAWILLSPLLAARRDVSLGAYVVLMGLPLLVAALARLPVGLLTDRYGARVMFPVVSLATAAAVVGLGLCDSLPAVVIAGAAAGVAGTAFVVGAALLSRTVRYGRRGLALGVFSLGTVVAVAISALSRVTDPGGRRAAVALGVALVGFAAVAAAVIRDHPGGYRGSPARRGVELVRVAGGTSLSLLYALALGGMVTVAVYLPAYLAGGLRLSWLRSLAVTAVVVVLGAVARLVGGWWTDRRPTAALLPLCYTAGGGVCLVLAVAPRLWWSIAPLIGVLVVCDGLAGGALLALIGKSAPADGAGAVMGVTGGLAALGAVVLSLLLAGVDRLSGSQGPAWGLLAAVGLAVAWYVRVHGLRVGLGLSVPSMPEPTPTAMTVAVVGEADTRWGAAAVVARLAELATRDELLVVYGSDTEPDSRRDTNVLLAGLRERLPRHRVVTVRVGSGIGSPGCAALVSEFVEAGAVPIAVAPSMEIADVAARLSMYLHADRVLKLSYSLAAGVLVQHVWDRRGMRATDDA